MSTAILIPARYGSTRFPGKPLTMLGDQHMIVRVYNACKESGLDTYVLTDHPLIIDLFPDTKLIVDTDPYENGTERCAGAVNKSALLSHYDRFINVQGDMPDVTIEMIQKTEKMLDYYKVSTVCALMPEEEQNNPNSVKLVRAGDKCLWFGRGMTGYGDWHLGVYGYHKDVLQLYPYMTGTREERVEKLEQLRWLKNGHDIGVLPVTFNGIEINTPDDVRKWHESNNGRSA